MKRLTKSRDRKLSGVLGGLAEYFGADPSLVRLAFIAVAIFTVIVPCVLLYIIAAIVIPDA
jgi:phage shock protein PspC (stress-responsive transcriptional regulator)